ncbi:MAG: ABC transporter permease, partial [Propionibacteriaceae bacterium]
MPENSRPTQMHFFADLDVEILEQVDTVDETAPPASLWHDAWRSLRVRPIFWVSAFLILLVVVVAAVPRLFTSTDPSYCDLMSSYNPPGPGHPFGFDRQGCDIYARTIYGARASVTVGILTTIVVVVLGAVVGALAGFYGKWFDSLLSRITDIFFAIPLVLAA